MNFPWERETGNLLRAAESLLEPAAFAWLAEVLPVVEQSDPTAAVDRLLQTMLKSGHDSGSEPEVFSASTQMYEPGHSVPDRRASPGRQDLFAPAVRVQDEPIPSLETSAQDKKSSWLGSSSTPSRKGGRPPEVQTPLQKSFDELSSCGDAGQGKKIGPVPRLITNFPELRNLFGAVVAHNQSEELGRDDGFGTTGGKSAENPNSINSSDQAMRIREDAPRQRLDIGHISPEVSRLSPRARVSAERIAYSGRHDVEGGRNEVPEAGIADARWNYRLPGATPVVAPAAENNPAPIFQNPWSDSRRPSLSNEGVAARLASNLQDLGWEEVLFDRLLIRWEERLREQAIRHSGFTGGLI